MIFHSSALRGRVGPDSTPRIYPTAAYLPRPSDAVDSTALAAAVAALDGAARPVIIAGNGVRVGQAWPQLAELAWALDIPIATTASGKGVFDETDPLAAGVIGPFGWPSANEVVGGADVVLAVGTKLGPHDTADEHVDLLDPARQTLIQVDIEPLNAAWTFPADHVLVGDAGVVLDRLRAACAAPSRADVRRRPRRRGARPLRRAGRPGVLRTTTCRCCRSGSSASSTRRSPTTPRSRATPARTGCS